MKHLDLFSGIGGFSLAAKWAGIETIQFVEKDLFCQKVLRKNFPNVPIHDDIKTFNYHHKIDLITAGFPCQPFSVNGKKKGIKDNRYLWPEVLRIIQSAIPSWIIAENVTGIIKMELKNILADLAVNGYIAVPYIIPACAINAPHRRDRVWIIAHCHSVRSYNWFDNREKRFLQENWIRDMEKIQQEWTQFIPKSWETFKTRDWFEYNTKFSGRNDGISSRLDRIKSLGNAIVPQIVYPILSFIKYANDNVHQNS